MAEVYVRSSEGADIHMPLGPEASQRLIAVMAKELVEATRNAAAALTAATVEHVTSQAALTADTIPGGEF